MIIYADNELPFIEQAFANLGDVRLFNGRQTHSGIFDDGDMLLLRSVTQVNEALIGNSRLQFVATATAGINHVDTDFLAARGIRFANAPGCNATAAAEYTLLSLLTLAQKRGRPLSEMRVGVVGCGQVGSRVVALCRAIGATVWKNDPPRAKREGKADFAPLAKLLEADAICLHTPLTLGGQYATHNLIDADFINALQPGSLLVSAGRGEVVDEAALKTRLASAGDLWVHLDVWHNEPAIDPEMLDLVALASPHVAGYSLEGKLRGTQMIMDAAAKAVRSSTNWDMSMVLPKAPELPEPSASGESGLIECMSQCIDLSSDDHALRAQSDFDRLRKDYKLRRELAAHCVQGRIEAALKNVGLQSCERR